MTVKSVEKVSKKSVFHLTGSPMCSTTGLMLLSAMLMVRSDLEYKARGRGVNKCQNRRQLPMD